MEIVIPENVPTGELSVLPNGLAVATIDKCIIGKSSKDKPKLTVVYVITEEMENQKADGSSTIGEKVLETMSLQPQALFSLAKLWKDVTGDTLPMGGYSKEEFEAILNEKLSGTEWNLYLESQVPKDGVSQEMRTVVTKRVKKS